jgi:hypothetical protein
LLILLAPRKTALASLRWSHFDSPDNPTLWTTPWELTKSRKKVSKRKREYLTPLPPLAQRIIKGIAKCDDAPDQVFPRLPVHETEGGRPTFFGVPLKRKLVEHGAPKDFSYHAWRHTVATFLHNAGHSEWERGLILNHAGSGVTADYSHGHPLALKRDMLCVGRSRRTAGETRGDGPAALKPLWGYRGEPKDAIRVPVGVVLKIRGARIFSYNYYKERLRLDIGDDEGGCREIGIFLLLASQLFWRLLSFLATCYA